MGTSEFRNIQLVLLSFSLAFLSITAQAQSFRQYTTKDGLSSMIVASVHQDRNGLMWFGTNDGLNSYDGLKIRNFQTTEEQLYLTGQTVGDIFEANNHVFWVLTNYGLNRIDHSTRTVKTFDTFDLGAKVVMSPKRDVYVFEDDHGLYYYKADEDKFEKIPINDLKFDDILTTFIDRENVLWIFMEGGTHRCFSINRTGNDVKLTPQTPFKHQEQILWSFYEEEDIYFVDATLTLYEYNLSDKTKYYIQDISPIVSRSGAISSILKHSGDFYIGFANSGVTRIKSMPEHRNQYQVEELNFRPGVLSLFKDKHQDIVWAGTNGEGVYMLFNEPSSLSGVLSASLPNSIHTPVTALYKDDKHTLWIGSRGNGMVNLYEYNPERRTGSRSEFFLPYNSLLGSTGVNAFGRSSKNLFWIGTDTGINYYSYSERRIKNISIVADNKPVKLVQAICEVNDSTLWIATAGEGLVKIHLVGTPETPIIASAKRIYAGDAGEAANMFTSAFRENNNIVWFGTQGNGVYKVESDSERMENFLFAKERNQPQNDVFSILKNNQGYWFATGEGLARMVGNEKTIFDENNGLPHKAIHGILEDNSGNLWLSTNRGIVKFNMEKLTSHLCKQADDRTITEFSDGACFKDPFTNLLLFGGENGFVTINENDFVLQDYTPHIIFNGLSVFGKKQNIYDYLRAKRGTDVIRLNYDQNVFAVSFVANDYIDGKDYTYFYKLNEQGDNWVDNGDSNVAQFTYLSSGKYTLSAKYRNNITGKEGPVSEVIIRILPRWYQTWWACLIYIAIGVGVLYLVRRVYLWYYNRRKVALVAAMKKEFHEMEARAKLDFFASMSNEFYGPLALIQNSSDKILADTAVDEGMRKHVSLIRNNTEQLKGVVCDINELRALEAGDKKQQIACLPVSELADALAAMFIEQAENDNIKYQIRIRNGLYWISDSYYLCRLMGNLLSDAFMNVSERGMVSIELKIVEKELRMTIAYTGHLPELDVTVDNFNYTQVIEALEQNGYADASTFDNRMLAINYGIVRELNGTFLIGKEEDKVTFTVSLPEYAGDISLDEVEEGSDQLPALLLPAKHRLSEATKTKHSPSRSTILIVDDNPDIHCLLTDLLHTTYNVVAVTGSTEVIDMLATGKYDVLIMKTNMPVVDGVEVVKMVKADPAISHIPCVLLASANRGEEREMAIESGANLYVPKPFDLNELVKEVSTLLQYKKIQKYLNSKEQKPFSLGDESFAGGEDKQFFEQLIGFIEQNMKNTELSVEMISEALGCTTQEFYSRLKRITKKTPNEIISAYRLSAVERMLVATNLSVEEVVSRVGFDHHRGSFFKLFMQEHGMTPKKYREQQNKMILKNL